MTAQSKKLNILVVDDDEFVQETTAMMLQDLGYDVVTASSADNALKIFKDDHIDLLVTDYVMPLKTGMDLINEVRTIVPNFPTIIVTGFAQDLNQELDLSIFKLLKPFNLHDLDISVNRAFHHNEE